MRKSLQNHEFQRQISLADAYRVTERFVSEYLKRGDTPVSDFLDVYAGIVIPQESTDPAAMDDFLDAAKFVLAENTAALDHIDFDDPVPPDGDGLVEVTLNFTDGSRRWCAFVTPKQVEHNGDCIVPGSEVRLWPGSPHIHLMSKLSEEAIGLALQDFERSGRLLSASIAY